MRWICGGRRGGAGGVVGVWAWVLGPREGRSSGLGPGRWDGGGRNLRVGGWWWERRLSEVVARWRWWEMRVGLAFEQFGRGGLSWLEGWVK